MLLENPHAKFKNLAFQLNEKNKNTHTQLDYVLERCLWSEGEQKQRAKLVPAFPRALSRDVLMTSNPPPGHMTVAAKLGSVLGVTSSARRY